MTKETDYEAARQRLLRAVVGLKKAVHELGEAKKEFERTGRALDE